MGTKSLVALDTDHIKQYVFGTDKLKEIRGASSILDRLNREEMDRIVHEADPDAETIYAHGGSGQFLVDSKKINSFIQRIKGAYSAVTFGGASISCAVQPLPDLPPDQLWVKDIPEELELLRWQMHDAKNNPPELVSLPSHPFIKTCEACGIEYAAKKDVQMTDDRDEENQESRYCMSCHAKRLEDKAVKTRIKGLVRFLHTSDKAVRHEQRETRKSRQQMLWARLFSQLSEVHYTIPPRTERPHKFDDFSEGGAKDYLGLIYADANNMGKRLELIKKLADTRRFANIVDNGVYRALAVAIEKHTIVKDIAGEEGADDTDDTDEDEENDTQQRKKPRFPFDVLLIGGDDIIIVTHASVAMYIARTMAKEFYEWTGAQFRQEFPTWSEEEKQGLTLSVGVVLAPVTYPFGLLYKLVEGTLRAAKKKGAELLAQDVQGESCINFVTVTGNTGPQYKTVSDRLQREVKEANATLYATLRPYTVIEMDNMLKLLQKGHEMRLGRTKLHQLREAIMEKNLTTSVIAGIAALRNWKDGNMGQRSFMVREAYRFGRPNTVPADATERLGQVTFPWYFDGEDQNKQEVYRTPLLDFVELYDFVREGEIEQ